MGCGCGGGAPPNGGGSNGRGPIVILNLPDATPTGAGDLPRPPGFDDTTARTDVLTTPDSMFGDDGIDVSGMAGPLPADDSDFGCGGDAGCSCREVDRACCCDEGDMEDFPIVNPGRPEPVPTPMPEVGRGREADPPPEAGSGQRTILEGPEMPRPPGAAPPTAKERDLFLPDTVARSGRVDMSSTAGPRRAGTNGGSGDGAARDCSCPDGQKPRCYCCCGPGEGPDRTILQDAPLGAPAGSGPAGEIPEYSRRPWGAEGASPLTQWSSGGAHGVAVTPTCPHGGTYGLYPHPDGGYYWGCPYDSQNVVGNMDYFEAAHPGSQQFLCVFGPPNWYRDPNDRHEYYGCPVDSKQRPIIPTDYQLGGGESAHAGPSHQLGLRPLPSEFTEGDVIEAARFLISVLGDELTSVEGARILDP